MAFRWMKVYRATARSFAWGAAVVFGSLMAACGGGEPDPKVPEVSTDAPPAAPPAASSQATASDSATNPPTETAPEVKATDPVAAPKGQGDGLSAGKPTAAPPALDARVSGSSDSAPAGVVASMEGKLVSKVGSVLVIQVAGKAPSAGTKCVLYRHFEQDIGPIRTSGWLGIADVTVKEVKGSSIKLDMVAEKSIIMVNGKKMNHFEAGNLIKLEISP